MARKSLRGACRISLAGALLLGAVTAANVPSAEASGDFHGGLHGGHGFSHGFHGAPEHGFHGGFGPGIHGFAHGFHGGFDHGFHHGFHDFGFHGFHHGFHHFDHGFHFAFGGFFPVYPVYVYPWPYRYYSPCGYYDHYGVWINVPCPYPY